MTHFASTVNSLNKGPRARSFIEGVSLIEGFVECMVIMFWTDSSVHYKGSVLYLGFLLKGSLLYI